MAAALVATIGCNEGGSASRECSADNARSSSQVRIKDSTFSERCVKAEAGEAFYFVNDDRIEHTATTKRGAPQSFDATLGKRGSTYNPKLEAGTYDVQCTIHKEEMTLIVE